MAIGRLAAASGPRAGGMVSGMVSFGGVRSGAGAGRGHPEPLGPARDARAARAAGSRTIRFLTDDEFPPLHFAGADGNPTGFSVELARAACEKLGLTCTIQARRFESLLDALRDKQGDAVAAAVPITTDLRARFTVTLPYFRTPARFAVRKANPADRTPDPKSLSGRSVAVVGGTAHEAYLKAFFPGAAVRSLPDLAAAEAALKGGEVDFVFADGLGLALWSAARPPRTAAPSRAVPTWRAASSAKGSGSCSARRTTPCGAPSMPPSSSCGTRGATRRSISAFPVGPF